MRSLIKGALVALALGAGSLPAQPVNMDMRLDRPYITEQLDQDLILRIQLDPPRRPAGRAPLNLALVLDKSGSMAGSKIERLREAARQALRRLRSDDIVTLIAFSDQAQVLLPSGPYGNGRAAMAAIERLNAAGSTALHAGVRQGLDQMSEFNGGGRVKRLILLSDGLANVGPATTPELAELGREAGSRGIPITTFGLGDGYNEDLMTRLALASDGNHAFISDRANLARFFDRELGDALAVSARDLIVEIRLGPGVRLKRSLDRQVEQDGDTVRWRLNQLSAGAPKHLLLELSAPATDSGHEAEIASATLSYSNAEGKPQDNLTGRASAKGATSKKAAARDPEVSAAAAVAKANLNREEAIRLKDAGQAEAAASLLRDSANDLRAARKATGVRSLGASASAYESQASEVAAPSANWNETRKAMKADSYKDATQQAY